jgi:hypothetical protein
VGNARKRKQPSDAGKRDEQLEAPVAQRVSHRRLTPFFREPMFIKSYAESAVTAIERKAIITFMRVLGRQIDGRAFLGRLLGVSRG